MLNHPIHPAEQAAAHEKNIAAPAIALCFHKRRHFPAARAAASAGLKIKAWRLSVNIIIKHSGQLGNSKIEILPLPKDAFLVKSAAIPYNKANR